MARSRAEIAGAATPAVSHRPAGFWIRGGAIVIDLLCLGAAQLVLGMMLWVLVGGRPAMAAARAFHLVVGTFYPVIFHWWGGQTLGKMVVQVRVVMVDGGPLSFGRAFLREIGYWVSGLTVGIGFLLAAFRSDKRALHDLIAGTRVEHTT